MFESLARDQYRSERLLPLLADGEQLDGTLRRPSRNLHAPQLKVEAWFALELDSNRCILILLVCGLDCCEVFRLKSLAVFGAIVRLSTRSAATGKDRSKRR